MWRFSIKTLNHCFIKGWVGILVIYVITAPLHRKFHLHYSEILHAFRLWHTFIGVHVSIACVCVGECVCHCWCTCEHSMCGSTHTPWCVWWQFFLPTFVPGIKFRSSGLFGKCFNLMRHCSGPRKIILNSKNIYRNLTFQDSLQWYAICS